MAYSVNTNDNRRLAALEEADRRGLLGKVQKAALDTIRQRVSQATGIVEPAMAVGTGALAHLAGIATGAGGLAVGSSVGGFPLGVDVAENAYGRVSDAMTYRPRTESGQATMQQLSGIMQNVGDRFNTALGQGAGSVMSAIPGQTAYKAPAVQEAITTKGPTQAFSDYVAQTTGSPTAGTVASWIPGAAELAFGAKGIGRLSGLEMGDIGGQGMGNQRGIFAGVKAKGADLDAKAKAEEMLAAGADRDQIWKDTGWMKDVDGQWKWEIDDSQMAMKGRDFDKEIDAAINAGDMDLADDISIAKTIAMKSIGRTRPLPSVMEHNDLFTAYPDIKDVGYKVDQDIPVGDAAYNPSGDVISLSPMNKYQGRDRLLHETQHAIQERENFGRGGSPKDFPGIQEQVNSKSLLDDINAKELGDLNELMRGKSIDDLEQVANRFAEIKGIDIDDAYDRASAWYVLNNGQGYDAEVKKIEDMVNMPVLDNFKRYKRLAGEAEARNVETRSNMTPEQRRAKAPWRTLDERQRHLEVKGQGQLPGIQQSVAGIKQVSESLDAKGIENHIYENKDRINIGQIVVPASKRNSGIGTNAMNEILDYADATGKRVELTPDSTFGGNKNRLIKFYKRFGFVENKGRNKDYEISELMYRPAKPSSGIQQSVAGGAKKGSGTTTLPASEFDALKQSGDNYETIYSGTNSNPATGIAPYGQKRLDGDQNIFGGIFGSQSKGAADSHGDTMQEMLVRKDKIISDGDFTDFVNDRDGGYARSEKIITDIVGEHKKTDLTPDEAEELLDYVTGDKSVFSSRYDENTGEWSSPPEMGIDRFEEIMGNYLDTEQGVSTGEIVWDLQAMKGEMARRLGYDAVGMMDEHGESVLVLNGILKSNK